MERQKERKENERTRIKGENKTGSEWKANRQIEGIEIESIMDGMTSRRRNREIQKEEEKRKRDRKKEGRKEGIQRGKLN